MKRTGVVKWFNDVKGYGVITPDGGGVAVIVDYAAIIGEGFKTLTEGEAVTFDDGEQFGDAANVRRCAA